jgi:tetratricopeptide (TPR) repeat protein
MVNESDIQTADEPDPFVDLVFSQPTLEQVRDVLRQQPERITLEFMQYLGRLSHNFLEDGRLEEGGSVARIGLEAAVQARDPAMLASFLFMGHRTLMSAGKLDEAVELARASLATLEFLATSGEEIVFVALAFFSQEVADVETNQGHFAGAREVLARASRVCHNQGSSMGELWLDLALLKVCLLEPDYKAARDYAARMVQLYLRLHVGLESEFEPPDRGYCYGILLKLFGALHYERETYEDAAAVAELAIRLDPKRSIAYYGLGNSQWHLAQKEEDPDRKIALFEASAHTWKTQIEHHPRVAHNYMNYGAVMLYLGKYSVAIEAFTKAIRLKPSDARLYFDRGHAYDSLGQYEEAIADYSQVIHLLETRRHAQKPARKPRRASKASVMSSEITRTRAQYNRDISERDLEDYARVNRATSYRALKRYDEALADAEFMIEHGDEAARIGGYLIKGTIYRLLQRFPEAIEVITCAIELAPSSPPVDSTLHKERAESYLAQGQLDLALLDIASVANEYQDPYWAIQQLTTILEKHPDNALARKWRGYAYFEAWRPSKAVEDLNAAAELLPEDPDIYLWKGLAGISVSPDEREEKWRNSITGERIMTAVRDLGTAAHLAPQNAEVRDSFTWVVDRVCMHMDMLAVCMHTGDEPGGIFSLIPACRAPLQGFINSLNQGINGQWEMAVDGLKAAQVGLAQAGLPVLAHKIHGHLADLYVRFYDLQSALDHIAEAEKIGIVIDKPMSESLMPTYEDARKRGWKQAGIEGTILEYDYLPVYLVGREEYFSYLNSVKADVLARTGDYEQAVALLATIEDQLEKEALLSDLSFMKFLGAAKILRNAGEYSRALSVLEKLELHVEDNKEKAGLLNTRGSIYNFMGKDDEARATFQRAYDLLEESDVSILPIVTMNLAQNLLNRKEYEQSLHLLNGIDIDKVARSENDRFLHKAMKSQVLFYLQRFAEAEQEALAAIEVADKMRVNLRGSEARISRHAGAVRYYDLAIISARRNGDNRMALLLIEKAKARTFLDQLATGYLHSPDSTKELQEIERDLIAKRELLEKLLQLAVPNGPWFDAFEVIAKLEGLEPSIEILAPAQGGTPRTIDMSKVTKAISTIDDAVRRLRGRMAEEVTRHNTLVSGETASLDDVKSILDVD